MKTYSKLIIGSLLMSSMLTSCYDLDLYPHDKISTETFWKTETHAKQGLMGVYNCMKNKSSSGPSVALFGQYYMLDGLSDIAICNDYSTLCGGTSTNRTGAYLQKWKDMYDGIAKANHAIQNIPNIEATDDAKNGYLAEARFMRALFYAHLVDFYGDVPIYDESWILSETFDKMLNPRSPKEEVNAFIIKDLDFAEQYLPYSWSKENYGRATKAAAVALRGKVNLYAEKWEEAKTDFQDLVDNQDKYGCGLCDDYASMFKPDTDENKEMIFFISNSGGVGDANDGLCMAFYLGSRSTYGSGWASLTLDPGFIDSYEMKDGRKFDWNTYIPGYTQMSSKEKLQLFSCKHNSKGVVTEYPEKLETIKAAYADRDPRLMQTCITPYSYHLGWNKNAPKMMQCVYFSDAVTKADNGYIEEGNFKWYWFRKFVPESDCGGQITNRTNTPINFPLIRYADVLLMLSECYNELGKVDEAVKYLNEVRSRPSTNMPLINNGDAWMEARTKEQVRERLIHERAVEFAGEGLRYSDIRRWKIAETVCNRVATDVFGDKRYEYNFSKDRDYLWPIPGVEIEMNEKLLPNNPNW